MFESPEQAEARRAYAQKKLAERGPKTPKKSWLTFQKSASMDSVTNAAREAETNDEANDTAAKDGVIADLREENQRLRNELARVRQDENVPNAGLWSCAF